nr:Hex [Oikopleura dioica]
MRSLPYSTQATTFPSIPGSATPSALPFLRSSLDLPIVPDVSSVSNYLLNAQLQAFALQNQIFNQITPRVNQVPLIPFPPHWNRSRRKGGQVRFTTDQTNQLEEKFETEKYLSPPDRRQMADALDLTERQVKTWFQNRRAKWRRQKPDTSEDESTSRTNIIDGSDTDSPPSTN